ncbi:MAG: MBL fold metallo-hydrolase [Bacteroidales bacterium]|nr:MBL fold metallo-hydrolase [Bacteroidales bacterium]
MKITMLGTGTSQGVPIIGCQCPTCMSVDPRDKRLRTSALVEIDGTHILIDAGPDLRQQLLRCHTSQLDAVLFTHEHKDHTAGLDDVRPINFLMHCTLNIYGLQRVMNVIKRDYDYAFKTCKYPGVPELKINTITTEPFFINQIEIIPISVKHLTLPILGYRIENFAYVTDASFITEKEKQKLMGLDVLIINALRVKEHYSHFNLAQALAVIEEVKPKAAYLTHISDQLGKHSEVAPTLPENVFLGIDGLTITL